MQRVGNTSKSNASPGPPPPWLRVTTDGVMVPSRCRGTVPPSRRRCRSRMRSYWATGGVTAGGASASTIKIRRMIAVAILGDTALGDLARSRQLMEDACPWHRTCSAALRVVPGTKVDLDTFDAGATHGWDKEEGGVAQQTDHELDRLTELQERCGRRASTRCWSCSRGSTRRARTAPSGTSWTPSTRRGVGSRLQGADARGAAPRLPVAHPRAAPAKGRSAIFNRSHYEDVLVVRVHDLVPKNVWQDRYEPSASSSGLLVEDGTTIVKFFLYIDRDEQRERLQARLDDPEEALEVLARRPGRARELGRLHRRVPGRA